jgi:histidyl-tRNA synthetase
MPDILPQDTAAWQQVERVFAETLSDYGYREIRVPMLERTELFRRSIGEVTDIVEKEMYTFDDRNGESLTLRPEATAGIVRAGLSHGLLHNARQKLWCTGPMFRYEKPQKGRQRQFHQFDAEALGFEGPDVDAELIIMSARIWRRLGLKDLALEINSIGTPESRRNYRDTLREYFADNRSALDEDSRVRLDRNPMRILDSKNPDMQPLIEGAPRITEYLDPGSQDHFDELKAMLDDAGVSYTVNSRLVRGLDYYTRTVFEWITHQLGSQGTVCGGGRYDGLVEQLGGKPTPAVGWASGLERLVELYVLAQGEVASPAPHVYIVAVGDGAQRPAFTLAEQLRDQTAGLRVEVNCGAGSFKAQFRRADRSGARYAVILGESEVEQETAGLKDLRGQDGDQRSVAWTELGSEIGGLIDASAD